MSASFSYDVARSANLARWNELVPLHFASSFYDVDGFKHGRVFLHDLERDELGELRGRTVLHLQCHFGLTTLSLARLGARATGVDFSSVAVSTAESLARETGTSATFVCGDVHRLREVVTGTFDIVFASYGVLCWLHDLEVWAQGIADSLAPGGFFYLVDEHPLIDVCSGGHEVSELSFTRPYFSRGAPYVQSVTGSYADRSAPVKNATVHLWQHTLGGVVNALLRQGLRLESLTEYPYSVYARFPGMTSDAQGRWRLPGDSHAIPYLFSLKASKAA